VRILALETTERIGSVAAMADGNLLFEMELNPRQRSAQSLAPGIKQLLEEVGWAPTDVDLVATTVGPGSFTGLRIGVVTAKAFAYGVQADILGVDPLEVIAAGAPAEARRLSVAVDAQRQQVVARTFQREPDGWFHPVGQAALVDINQWLGHLPPGVCLAGPVLRKMADRVPEALTVLDSRYWAPSAVVVARLAAKLHAAGRRDDIWMLVPQYSRRSAAEEKCDNQSLGDGMRS